MDAITISDGTSELRVELRPGFGAGSLICPACREGVRYLLFRDGWGCRHCRQVDYQIRHRFRTVPLLRRQYLLRRLAQRSVVGLREVELRRQLVEVEEQIAEKIGNAHRRAYARRRRAGR